MGIVWENMTPGTELPHDFCAWIGPLQLGVVLVFLFFYFYIQVLQTFTDTLYVIEVIMFVAEKISVIW